MTTRPLDLTRPLRETTFVAFDTETTGLVASTERVIELSGVRFSFDGELDRFETLFDPQRPIPPDSIRMHGIKDEDVQGQPLFADAVGGFLRLVDGTVVLAHNAEFDVSFLAHEAHRSKVPMPRVPAGAR